MPKFVVFSDLDGTLLDHNTYDFKPAKPALRTLRERGVPLVLASSKTGGEISPLRHEIGFADCPAIVENGAGVLAPDHDHKLSDTGHDTEYKRLRAALERLPTDLRSAFEGFGDMSAERVCELTQLDLATAKLARNRMFSEPGVWSGSEDMLSDFLIALAEAGVDARRGGRFLTLSFGANKADRMAEIALAYRTDGVVPTTIALGDAPNDIEMLEAANFGIIIRNPSHAQLPVLSGEDQGHITRSDAEGPWGWNDALLAILGSDDSVQPI